MTAEPVKLNLSVTERAARQVKNIMAREGKEQHGLRVSVANGGCSGMSYHLSFDKVAAPDDTVLDVDGLKVYVDAESARFLQGTEIDFASSLYGGGFKFTNPNATATCGCGTSFSA